MRKLLLIPFLLLSTACFASAPNRTYNYVSHAVIDPNQNNTNENTLYSYLQNGVDTFAAGSITDIAISPSAAVAYSKLNLLNSIQGTDISSSAAIPYSKLNLTGTIVNADISSSAAITDSKLDQITTASKVSGTAITGLASLPSGAGVVPTANLGSGTANNTTFLRGDQTYAAPTSPAITLVSTTSISAATTTGAISITNGQTYFVQYNFDTFASAGDDPCIRFNGDATSGNYKYVTNGRTTGGSLTTSSASATSILITSNNGVITSTPGGGLSGSFYVQQVGTGSSQYYVVWGQSVYIDSSAGLFSMVNYGGRWGNSANVTSFAILNPGGTATMTGSVYLYKVATS